MGNDMPSFDSVLPGWNGGWESLSEAISTTFWDEITDWVGVQFRHPVTVDALLEMTTMEYQTISEAFADSMHDTLKWELQREVDRGTIDPSVIFELALTGHFQDDVNVGSSFEYAFGLVLDQVWMESQREAICTIESVVDALEADAEK